MKRGLATAAVLIALLAEAAGAANTRFDQHGTTLVDGRKVFPIVLAKGPEPGTTTPAGADALDEVVDAGVNFFKTGPATRPWWPEDISEAITWNREAAARGAYTWVNLATLSDAKPGSLKETRIREVVSALEGDPSHTALGLWKGADEPWWGKVPPSSLQFAYCIGTSRGQPSWCADRQPADDERLWVTIQAPRGTAADLAPYTSVTDIHGVDHYPVTFANPDPDLHEIGEWTDLISSITPSGAVWTTLQICASGSSDPSGSGQFVLPTRRQERYMIYDAIINGARSLAFYGGNIFRCWNQSDTAREWNWTFWDAVLEDLIREINEDSPLAPALVSPGSTKALSSSEPGVQVISRQGATPSELWVMAARNSAGSGPVTISGLPAGTQDGTVYTEGRSIDVTDGSFTDPFARWDVHVYRLTIETAAPAAEPPPPPPASQPPPPPSADSVPGRVTLRSSRAPGSQTRARAGRIFTIRVRVRTGRGTPVTKGSVTCAARVGKVRLRTRGKGWRRGDAYCSWRVPRQTSGKRLRGVIRIVSQGSARAHPFARRIL